MLKLILVSAVLSGEPIYIYGFASWYGKEFEGRKTASGEVFDSSKLTAAHKTLPLGTLIEVENLANGKKVVVKVNDRGPYVKGRVLDLSRAAAEKLGYIHDGIAYVRFRVVSKVSDSATPIIPQSKPQKSANLPPQKEDSDFIIDEDQVVNSSQTDSNKNTTDDNSTPLLHYTEPEGEFAVQVGAFIKSENAYKLVERLKDAGFKSIYTAILSMNGRNYTRVRIGDFATKNEAQHTLEKLRDKGFNGIIITLRKEA